jgi:hypothetical protein
VHPGRHTSTVLSGAVVLRLGERTILPQAGETAQFSTMAPQASGAHDRAAEVLYLTGRGARLQAQPLLLRGGVGLVLGANGRVSVSSTGISHRHHTQGSHAICS